MDDNATTIKVFVYGTLLEGESNHHVVKPYLKGTSAGKLRGSLYDVGHFPALILDECDSEVQGAWFTVSVAGLRSMDRLEGYYGPNESNLYDRVWARDIENGEEGWVYVWRESKGLPLISSAPMRAAKPTFPLSTFPVPDEPFLQE